MSNINPSSGYWYISTITDVFLNQKRVNVCEHTEDGKIYLLHMVGNEETSISFLFDEGLLRNQQTMQYM